MRNRDGVARIKEKALGSRDELARMRDWGGGGGQGRAKGTVYNKGAEMGEETCRGRDGAAQLRRNDRGAWILRKENKSLAVLFPSYLLYLPTT